MGCRQVFIMLMEAADSPDPVQFKETELFRKCREMGIIPESESDLKERLSKDAAKPLFLSFNRILNRQAIGRTKVPPKDSPFI